MKKIRKRKRKRNRSEINKVIKSGIKYIYVRDESYYQLFDNYIKKNKIDLKIFLKLLPTAPQNFTENSHVLTFGSGQIIQTRGGNSRVLKAYDLTFNYDLCYHLE